MTMSVQCEYSVNVLQCEYSVSVLQCECSVRETVENPRRPLEKLSHRINPMQCCKTKEA